MIEAKYVTFCCLVANSCLTLLQPHGLQSSRFLCPWDFPDQNTREGCSFSYLGNILDPGIKPASLALAGGFFTTEPPGKPICKLSISINI